MRAILAWKKKGQFPTIRKNLEKAFPDTELDCFTIGDKALAAMERSNYDLLILGSELSDMDFEKFLGSLMGIKVPVIVVIYPLGLNEKLVRVLRRCACAFIREDEIDTPLLTYTIETRMEKSFLEKEILTYQQTLVESALRDGLTQLYNYRFFKETLSREFHRALRYGHNLTLIMWDIDDFKLVNDAYGHMFGDFVLKSLGQILQDKSRRSDIVVRYGGEEFAGILPDTTSKAAYTVGERIRICVAQTPFLRDNIEAHITVSAGIADMKMKGITSEEDLVRFADRALYSAKAMGKNKIIIYDSSSNL